MFYITNGHYMIYQNSLSSLLSKLIEQGFPGGPVIKNLPCNAGKTGFIPGPRRSHMLRSSYARAQLLSPQALEPMLYNKRSPHTATMSSLGSPQPEKSCVQQRRPRTGIDK